MKKFVEKAKELEKEVSSKNQLDDSVFIGFHKLFREFQNEYIKFDVQNLYLKILGEFVTKQTATWKGPQDSSVCKILYSYYLGLIEFTPYNYYLIC